MTRLCIQFQNYYGTVTINLGKNPFQRIIVIFRFKQRNISTIHPLLYRRVRLKSFVKFISIIVIVYFDDLDGWMYCAAILFLCVHFNHE